jgi:hypothetical protein
MQVSSSIQPVRIARPLRGTVYLITLLATTGIPSPCRVAGVTTLDILFIICMLPSLLHLDFGDDCYVSSSFYVVRCNLIRCLPVCPSLPDSYPAQLDWTNISATINNPCFSTILRRTLSSIFLILKYSRPHSSILWS